jgi:phosphohistidine phosphatase
MAMLFIIRHAWAFERDTDRFPDDRLRPLTPEGQKRFRKVVKELAKRGLMPEVIATSPLIRCTQTADILAELVPGEPAVSEIEALAPDSDPQAMIAWSAHHAGRNLAWVGHAPDVDNLAAALLGAGGDSIRFAKGAVAAIDFDQQVAPGQGRLQWLVTAKVLGC